MKFKILLFLVLLMSSVGLSTSSTDYYVSTTGDNANDGLSIENAWATPSYATQQIIAGDILYLIDGTWYDEHLVLSNSGNETHRINITAYNGTPTLDGLDRIGNGIDINDKNYTTISNLRIINYSISINNPGSYINITDNFLGYSGGTLVVISDVGAGDNQGSHYNYLDNNTLEDSGWNGVQLIGREYTGWDINAISDHIYILNNRFLNHTRGHTGGIDIMGENNEVFITNNYFNNDEGGLFTHAIWADNPKNVTVNNNIVINSNHFNIQGIENALVENNTFYDVTDAIVSVDSDPDYISPNAIIRNNTIINSTNPAINVRGDDTLFENNTLSGSPHWVLYDLTPWGYDYTSRNHDNSFYFYIQYPSHSNTIEYTDNTVFTVTKHAGSGTYNYTSPKYYSLISNATYESTNNNIISFHVEPYTMTMTPDSNSSTIAITKFNTSEPIGNVAVNFTANSTNGTQVDFTIWNLFDEHDYQIKKGGIQFQNVTSNSTGYISFSNSAWSEQTFTVQDLGYNESIFNPDAVPYLSKKFNTYQSGNITHLDTILSTDTKLDFFRMVVT